MKAKVIVSLGAVVGLAALSAAAFVSTADTVPASAISEWGTVPEAAIAREPTAVVIEEKPLTTETIPAAGPAEEPSHSEEQVETQMSMDAYLLAKIAMAEAEGEDTEGKALVMLVVLNRVEADGFPDTIEDVIYQTGQFSPVGSGRFDRMEPDDDCWKALSMIELEGWDESMGATYFESRSESTWHEENLHFLFRHGSHYFYTDKGDADE